MTNEIDTTNLQLVGMQGDRISVLIPRPSMTKTEALAHAAWIVVLADTHGEFDEYLKAVSAT